MIFYRFHQAGGAAVVITNDITGANLPKTDDVWMADGQTEVSERSGSRLGVDAREIIDAIGREGLFVGSLRRA